MKLNYVKTKLDVYNEVKLSLKVKLYGDSINKFRYIIMLAIMRVRLIVKRDLEVPREFELLDDNFTLKVGDSKEIVVSYEDIIDVIDIEGLIIVQTTASVSPCIPYKAFKGNEEREKFLHILRKKCDLKIREKRKFTGGGVITGSKRIEELSEEEKNELSYKEIRRKKDYLRMMRLNIYNESEIVYKRLLNANALSIAGIFIMIGACLTNNYGLSRIILIGVIAFSIVLVSSVNKHAYSKSRAIRKAIENELSEVSDDTPLESRFLITDSQLLYKINGVEKIYPLNDIKSFKKGKALIAIRVKEKDGTILPIVIATLLVKEKDKVNNLVNSISKRCEKLESIKIEIEKEKIINRLLNKQNL